MIYLAAGGLAVFLYCLILLLFSKKAMREDKLKKRLYDLGKEVDLAYAIENENLNKPFFDRAVKPVLQKLASLVTNLIPTNKKTKNSSAEQIRKMLMQAAWTVSLEEYMVIQLILMIGGGILGAMFGLFSGASLTDCFLYFIIGVFAAYALLRNTLATAGTRRKEAIEKQLADMLDLLSVSVAAGLGFERAILHIIETMDGPLIDEFAVTYREMSMGRTRKEALTLLAERCNVEDLSSVTSAIIQAGQLGIPLGNVLQSQAAAIRRARRSKVQEKAARVSTKILLPMVGLIFPVLMIVLMGPSIIRIIDQFMEVTHFVYIISFSQEILMKQTSFYCGDLPVATDVKIADTFFSRFRGLMMKKQLGPSEGLLLKKCSSIHCLFMRFPIDVVYLDKNMRVVGIETVKPWRLGHFFHGAWHVLELGEGKAEKLYFGALLTEKPVE